MNDEPILEPSLVVNPHRVTYWCGFCSKFTRRDDFLITKRGYYVCDGCSELEGLRDFTQDPELSEDAKRFLGRNCEAFL